MVLKFIFLFRRLNLALLLFEKSQKMIEKIGLISIKLVEIFEYKKNNNRYYQATSISYNQNITYSRDILSWLLTFISF